MSKPIVFNWVSASAISVSMLQTLAGAGSLFINGTLASPSRPFSPSNIVSFPGISRVVTLTSTNNLGGVNFTITGTLNGIVVSETRVGPNNNTVSTTQLFQTVTSITTDAAAAAVSAGTGQTGRTNWYSYDYYIDNANLGIQVVISGTINYSLQTTLDNVNTVANPAIFNPVVAMTAATTNQMVNLIQTIQFADIIINSSTAGATLVATFIQQGIKG